MILVRNSFSLWLLALLLIIGIPLEGFGNQRQKEIVHLQKFLSIPLKKNEVVYMSLGDASNIIVRIADKTVLFDPAYLSDAELDVINEKGVDLVLYTHGHGDHYDMDTALKLFGGSNPYVGVPSDRSRMLSLLMTGDKLISLASGKSFSYNDMTIDVLEGKHVGPILLFRVTINGIKIFHGGDSAYVPLHSMVSNIAFVPTGKPSPTCNPKYAFKMVADIKPIIAIPMHGTELEHKEFKKLMDENIPDTKVIISDPYEIRKVAIN